MRIVLKVVGAFLLLVVLSVGGFYAWASIASGRSLARTIGTHTVGFPIPFPFDSVEVAEVEASEEAAVRLALDRARERGSHLVAARYGCGECHGEDLSGGVMIDAPVIGRLFGPNLTGGRGSRVAEFAAADWDRIVRHGVLPDGRPATMPAEDFQRMSDQELSDIVVYIRSLPAVDNEVAPSTLGTMGKVLMATGQLTLSADEIGEHDLPHPLLPPVAEPSVDFGGHLAATCTGCHGADLVGGPIVGGDPSWPPARNLTPHPTGLAGWTYEQFVTAMREARRPDGNSLRVPMTMIAPYAQRMTDVELEALWTYLRSLPPVASEG